MAGTSPNQINESHHNPTSNSINHTRSLTCAQCNSSFNRLAHLKRHQKTHRIEKPYRCSYCSVASSRKDVIVRHTRNFHPDSVQKCAESGARTQLRSPAPHESTYSQPAATAGTRQHGQNTQILDVQVPLMLEVSSTRTHSNEYPVVDNLFNLFEPDYYADARTWPNSMPNSLLSPGLFPEGLLDQQNGLQSSHVNQPMMGSGFTGCHPSECNGGYLVIDDNQYTNAKENLDRFDINQKLPDFCFPSKYTLIRWLSAFFEHMAPIMPVVHRPTFEIASVPSPLLIEIIACGALYTSEQSAAAELHTAALVLMREIDAIVITEDSDNIFQLWVLQTSLLISYVSAFTGDRQKEHHVVETFSSTIKLAQNALKVLKTSEIKSYHEWVYQETISRCIASSILLGVAQFCSTNDQCFALPVLEARFPLPSSTTAWLADEVNWTQPSQVMYSSDVLKLIFEGQKPSLPDSEFGFLTIVSTVLCHICLFESVIGSKHPELFTAFVNKMDLAVDALNALWQQQTSTEFIIQSTTSPSVHLTRALLHSITYHLHASSQLIIMKRLVQSSFVARAHEDVQNLFQGISGPSLDKALICAAFAMRSDCRSGLGYLKNISTHRFGPLSAIAAFEGGLLLSWYLHVKHSNPSALEPDSKLDKLIEEASLEMSGVQMRSMDPPATMPLVTYADLLHNEVWHLLLVMSHQLKQLAVQLELRC